MTSAANLTKVVFAERAERVTRESIRGLWPIKFIKRAIISSLIAD